MGDRLGIQGAVGFIFTLLTVTGTHFLSRPHFAADSHQCLRPHHVEHTPSRPIWEVKLTAWERPHFARPGTLQLDSLRSRQYQDG